MADFWIVSEWPFKRHPTFEDANKELLRLHAVHHEKKNFRIYRCKTHVEGASGNYERMKEALDKIAGGHSADPQYDALVGLGRLTPKLA